MGWRRWPLNSCQDWTGKEAKHLQAKCTELDSVWRARCRVTWLIGVGLANQVRRALDIQEVGVKPRPPCVMGWAGDGAAEGRWVSLCWSWGPALAEPVTCYPETHLLSVLWSLALGELQGGGPGGQGCSADCRGSVIFDMMQLCVWHDLRLCCLFTRALLSCPQSHMEPFGSLLWQSVGSVQTLGKRSLSPPVRSAEGRPRAYVFRHVYNLSSVCDWKSFLLGLVNLK